MCRALEASDNQPRLGRRTRCFDPHLLLLACLLTCGAAESSFSAHIVARSGSNARLFLFDAQLQRGEPSVEGVPILGLDRAWADGSKGQTSDEKHQRHRRPKQENLQLGPDATVYIALDLSDLKPKERYFAGDREHIVVPVRLDEAAPPKHGIRQAVDSKERVVEDIDNRFEPMRANRRGAQVAPEYGPRDSEVDHDTNDEEARIDVDVFELFDAAPHELQSHACKHHEHHEVEVDRAARQETRDGHQGARNAVLDPTDAQEVVLPPDHIAVVLVDRQVHEQVEERCHDRDDPVKHDAGWKLERHLRAVEVVGFSLESGVVHPTQANLKRGGVRSRPGKGVDCARGMRDDREDVQGTKHVW